jgi:hypothetical protein
MVAAEGAWKKWIVGLESDLKFKYVVHGVDSKLICVGKASRNQWMAPISSAHIFNIAFQ